jgi:hypothetical protein
MSTEVASLLLVNLIFTGRNKPTVSLTREKTLLDKPAATRPSYHFEGWI